MQKKRTNFKAMDHNQFIAYLKEKSIPFEQKNVATIDNINIIEVRPEHFRLVSRLFEKTTKNQLFNCIIKNESNKDLQKFINILNDKIINMSTKDVYHPRRLLPKWLSLESNEEKLELFRKYMKAPTSSIGFLRLIEVNLPNKTMESIIIDHPEFESLIKIEGLRQKCIDKFRLYKNGKLYLKERGLI